MSQPDALPPIRLISFPPSIPAKPLPPLPTDLREWRVEEFLRARSLSVISLEIDKLAAAGEQSVPLSC